MEGLLNGVYFHLALNHVEWVHKNVNEHARIHCHNTMVKIVLVILLKKDSAK